MQVRLDALATHLAKRLAPLYVVHGDEHLLAIEASDRIRAAVRSGGYTERDVLQVDRHFKWNRLVESGQSLSLFGDRKLIELRIPGGKPGKDGSVALQAYAKSVTEGDTITLITLPRLDGDQKRSAWFAALEAAGITIEAPVVERARLPAWIADRLAAQGQHADAESLAFLVDRVEGNLLAAHQEVQKLGLLYPTGTLRFDDVRDAVLDVARYDVFKLGEAMLAGDAARVARMVDGLRGEGESPVLVHWAVTEEVRALYRAKLGVAQGQPLSTLMRQLRVWGARERLFEGAMRRLTLPVLRRALARCAEIDRVVKGLRNLGGQPMGDPWTELSRLGLLVAGRGSLDMNATDLQTRMLHIGHAARIASRAIAKADTARKNRALLAIAGAIRRDAVLLKAANGEDLAAARIAGLDAVMLDRLTLTDQGIEAMATGLEQIVALPDPIGEIGELRDRPSGIQVGRMRVPLGVVGIIYEARPNVTIDAAGLTIKSGNAAILRGGSEAIRCNGALAKLIHEGLQSAGLPADVVQVIDSTDRAAVGAMITMPEYIDVIVPRGGKGLIERLMRESRVPMIKHLDGLCHVYVDAAADLDDAVRIADNAKTQRYGTCNTMETLLVSRDVAAAFLPRIGRIYADKGVEMRACPASFAILADAGIAATAAGAGDFDVEWLAPIASVRVVDDLDAAIEHIDLHGSKHTDTIVTANDAHALRFLREVDSASVIVNASTRFADGFEFGLGAEIGISNDKLHARGPVGLEGLTSLKYVVFGHGEVRS